MSQGTNGKRLIEVAFPLKQASLDSVHEKNVRHGHISTLHIWPARRPLAACRAALIATLLPDPGTPEKRKEILERLGGKVIETIEKKKMPSGKVVERVKEETVGGILHWGRESGPDLQWFRDEIRKAYGGRAPKVLDPFAGGGAIPLEAMRLGCEVTASDINPVAWFILKCTLEYPQKLAGQKRPLPDFILKDREFMEAFFKSQGLKGAKLRTQLHKLGLVEGEVNMALPGTSPILDADLAWHVRAWGKWVLNRARAELASFYPTYADFEPIDKEDNEWERREMRLVPCKPDGTPDIDALNKEFDAEHLKDRRKARWIAKPTVAYLWARTVTCKNCRATVPLLKTRWLCKKDNKRVLLTMEPSAKRTGVSFGIRNEVPVVGANAAQRREHDKRIGQGTMSRNGAWCRCCGQPGTVAMTAEDIRQEAMSGRLGSMLAAVAVHGTGGKQYRLPTDLEGERVAQATAQTSEKFRDVPFGLPCDQVPEGGSRTSGGSPFTIFLYGFDAWQKLFAPRQLLAMAVFVRSTAHARVALDAAAYPPDWTEAVPAYLSVCLDRLADYNSNVCNWDPNGEYITHTFQRFALPIKWDFAEVNPLSGATGDYLGGLDWIARYLSHGLVSLQNSTRPVVKPVSATTAAERGFDLVLTDPPYYDAIPYADLMDFFYVWLRRTLHGMSPEVDKAFQEPLSPKWDYELNEGELIDDPSRFGGDKLKSKAAYEEGMFSAFETCLNALAPDGRMVIVFAHKQPDAWETLASAVIRAGFVVDASWPIQTEMGNRTRAFGSAALSSSVWLVCRKRDEIVRPGWDDTVLKEMRANINTHLRQFWDAGIRGPDFVWAATGPALEAYSKYPVVKKANDPGKLMEVSEFLRQVRRIVVDFVVGRLLSHDGGAEVASGLDDVTTYYLLHRNDFKMNDAPAGACILYAISCNLSDSALADQYEILARTGGQVAADEEEEETEAAGEEPQEMSEGTGSTFRLLAWNQRTGRNLGEGSEGRPAPLIDQMHRLTQLWKAGDQVKVDEYLDASGLRSNQLFHQVLQALIELSGAGGPERSILESLSNHVGGMGAKPETPQLKLGYAEKGGPE